MRSKSKVDQQTLKNLNRRIILNLIRKYKEISRAELAAFTKLSPTTVSTIISDLVSKKMVVDLGVGQSSGGRKPLMIGLNPNARFVAGVVLNPKGAEFSLVNLNDEILYTDRTDLNLDGLEDTQEVLLKGLNRLISSCPDKKGKMVGIGISIPGVIDHENGKVLYSSKLHLHDFCVSELIKENLGIKGFVFKDTDALILGEFIAGIGRSCPSFAYIHIEDGVGMSYINSGKLLHTGYGGGFELGHITIDSNGPLCRCGNRGCLGAVVSDLPLSNRINKLKEKGYSSMVGGDANQLTLHEIVEGSNQGDKACRYVLEEQARVIGTAVASVINLLNPGLVAVGGPLIKCTWDFIGILRDTVRDRALEIFSRDTRISYAQLGERSALIGMANEIFEREVFNSLALHLAGKAATMDDDAFSVSF